MAADQGHATAQFNLGYMYENGIGVQEDSVQAARWYRLAEANGDPNAQSALSRIPVGIPVEPKRLINCTPHDVDMSFAPSPRGVPAASGVSRAPRRIRAVDLWSRVIVDISQDPPDWVLDALGVGSWSFLRRNLTINCFKPLQTALWECAIRQQQPDVADALIRLFRTAFAKIYVGADHHLKQILETTGIYQRICERKVQSGVPDFNRLSRQLVNLVLGDCDNPKHAVRIVALERGLLAYYATLMKALAGLQITNIED